MTNIAIFASGSGTNAENIINHFASSPIARVTLIITDNPNAYVIQRAERLGVACKIFSRSEIKVATNIINFIRTHKIDYIVLAGFLSLLPQKLTTEYRGRIVNIHPSLLPKYGGKGMYGERVHRAVIENNESRSGITIHEVDEHYDKGRMIFQCSVNVAKNETAESLAKKIHELEYKHFPKVIEEQIIELNRFVDNDLE